jgi:hypothetical protein
VHPLNSQPVGKQAVDQAEQRKDEAARRRQPTAALQAHTVITISASNDECSLSCQRSRRGSEARNDNTSGLLYQYLPKGTGLAAVTQNELDAVVAELNGWPRQTLGWQSASEKFADDVAIIAETAARRVLMLVRPRRGPPRVAAQEHPWNAALPEGADPEVFGREIVSAIQGLSLGNSIGVAAALGSSTSQVVCGLPRWLASSEDGESPTSHPGRTRRSGVRVMDRLTHSHIESLRGSHSRNQRRLSKRPAMGH